MVTFPPTASTLDLMSSAASLLTASLMIAGAPSTNPFASLRPNPVIPRISLITLTFAFASESPVSSTSNSVFSSAASSQQHHHQHRQR